MKPSGLFLNGGITPALQSLPLSLLLSPCLHIVSQPRAVIDSTLTFEFNLQLLLAREDNLCFSSVHFLLLIGFLKQPFFFLITTFLWLLFFISYFSEYSLLQLNCVILWWCQSTLVRCNYMEAQACNLKSKLVLGLNVQYVRNVKNHTPNKYRVANHC